MNTKNVKLDKLMIKYLGFNSYLYKFSKLDKVKYAIVLYKNNKKYIIASTDSVDKVDSMTCQFYNIINNQESLKKNIKK